MQYHMVQKSDARSSARKKRWTGFETKTFWDWMELLIIPLVLAGATILFNIQQVSTSLTAQRQQQESKLQATKNQQEAVALTGYINYMGDLLITHHLRNSQPGAEISVLARAKTFVTLKRLNGERKGELLQFLYEAQLIGKTSTDAQGKTVSQTGSIVSLSGLDASQANLQGADLQGADLQGADLQGTNLQGADLRNANLRYARITPAQLSKASSLANTQLPDGSQFPSRSWPIPGRGANCVQLVNSSCVR